MSLLLITIDYLFEPHLSDDGQIKKHGAGFTFFWKGRKVDGRRVFGVMLAAQVSQLPRSISGTLHLACS